MHSSHVVPQGLCALPTIVALGSDVGELAVGMRVVAGLRSGGYAEYAIAPALTTFPIPATLDFPRATALFLQGLTAYGLLHTAAQLQPGETVLVHAGWCVGLQLARLAGAGLVLGTASTLPKLQLIQQLGADVAINYTDPAWVEPVNTATNTNGVHVILDSVGGAVGTNGVPLLGAGGRMVVDGAASGEPTMVAAQQLAYKGQSVLGYSMGTQMQPARMRAGVHELLRYIAAGPLQITVGQTVPLSEAATAHQQMAERRTTGKVVLAV